jgi:quercetin dioxygenase-like cupin family protein
MAEEVLLVVPLVVGVVAAGAAVVSGNVALVTLVPGLSALAVFAVGGFVVARYLVDGDPSTMMTGEEDGQEPDPADATVTAVDGGGGVATSTAGADAGPDRNGNANTGPATTGTPSADGDGPAPLVRRAGEVRYEGVEAADGMRKGVLVGEADGAPNLAIRRFVLAPGASVPRHTNEIEHEQYVIEGGYTVGIGEDEYELEAGDAVFVPSGVVHWYRNDGPNQGSFVCAVPTGDDRIELV